MNVQQITRQNNGIAPGFHFLRHALSLIILMFHCYTLTSGGNWNTGYVKGSPLHAAHLTGSQLTIELLRPGLFALVAAFFALSGYLVAGSAIRSKNVRVFLTLRALRIIPALTTEITLSALILGPCLTALALSQYFSDPLFFRYFGNILGHVSYLLPGVYGQDFHTGKINANLWTLAPEFYSYALMTAVMVLGILYNRKLITLVILAVMAAAFVAGFPALLDLAPRQDSTHFTTWFIALLFWVGVLFALHPENIPVKPWLFVASAISYFLLMYVGGLDVLASLPLTYCTVYVGMQSFAWFDRLVKDDLSYGIYLYGYPITQVIIHVVLPRLKLHSRFGELAFVTITSITLTVVFSAWSWRTIEKPALKLKKLLMPAKNTRPELKPLSS